MHNFDQCSDQHLVDSTVKTIICITHINIDTNYLLLLILLHCATVSLHKIYIFSVSTHLCVLVDGEFFSLLECIDGAPRTTEQGGVISW